MQTFLPKKYTYLSQLCLVRNSDDGEVTMDLVIDLSKEFHDQPSQFRIIAKNVKQLRIGEILLGVSCIFSILDIKDRGMENIGFSFTEISGDAISFFCESYSTENLAQIDE